MKLFIDTSAILAILSKDDIFHKSASVEWTSIVESNTTLFCSNYVLVETIALIKKRFGSDAVRLFVSSIQPLFNVIWVDESLHNMGLSILKTVNQRELSLVDCVSFEVMRQLDIERVFTFDPHFSEQGFKVIPDK